MPAHAGIAPNEVTHKLARLATQEHTMPQPPHLPRLMTACQHGQSPTVRPLVKPAQPRPRLSAVSHRSDDAPKEHRRSVRPTGQACCEYPGTTTLRQMPPQIIIWHASERLIPKYARVVEGSKRCDIICSAAHNGARSNETCECTVTALGRPCILHRRLV